jgi:hypothetical protein
MGFRRTRLVACHWLPGSPESSPSPALPILECPIDEEGEEDGDCGVDADNAAPREEAEQQTCNRGRENIANLPTDAVK